MAGVLGLDGRVRVGEGAAVVQPHRGADILRRRCGGAGEGWRLGPQRLQLEGADGRLVRVIGGFPHR